MPYHASIDTPDTSLPTSCDPVSPHSKHKFDAREHVFALFAQRNSGNAIPKLPVYAATALATTHCMRH